MSLEIYTVDSVEITNIIQMLVRECRYDLPLPFFEECDSLERKGNVAKSLVDWLASRLCLDVRELIPGARLGAVILSVIREEQAETYTPDYYIVIFNCHDSMVGPDLVADAVLKRFALEKESSMVADYSVSCINYDKSKPDGTVNGCLSIEKILDKYVTTHYHCNNKLRVVASFKEGDTKDAPFIDYVSEMIAHQIDV